MNKDTLSKAVESFKEQTQSALQTVYDALNSGQKKKLLKDEKIAQLFEHYAIEIEGNET